MDGDLSHSTTNRKTITTLRWTETFHIALLIAEDHYHSKEAITIFKPLCHFNHNEKLPLEEFLSFKNIIIATVVVLKKFWICSFKSDFKRKPNDKFNIFSRIVWACSIANVSCRGQTVHYTLALYPLLYLCWHCHCYLYLCIYQQFPWERNRPQRITPGIIKFEKWGEISFYFFLDIPVRIFHSCKFPLVSNSSKRVASNIIELTSVGLPVKVRDN